MQRLKNKELVNKSGISKFINNSDLDTKMKILATKVELKAEQDKIEKLQTNDSSLFIGQSYFVNDESQNFLIFQPIFKIFTMPAGLTDSYRMGILSIVK